MTQSTPRACNMLSSSGQFVCVQASCAACDELYLTSKAVSYMASTLIFLCMHHSPAGP
jgi:hypothetical protein